MLKVIKKECLGYKSQCENLIASHEGDVTVLRHCRLRAERICASLEDLPSETASEPGDEESEEAVLPEERVDILKAFVFVVLDFTFFAESEIAERNFTDDDSRQSVERLLAELDKPRHVYDSFSRALTLASSTGDAVSGESASASPPPSPPDFDAVVGEDLAECLYWRKGALIYMFHSAREADISEEPAEETKRLLTTAVGDLRRMLSVRQDFKVIDNDAFVYDDGNSLQLIQRGLFSDTHVLALMYAGEMCYWLVKWTSTTADDRDGANDKASKEDDEDDDDSMKTLCPRSVGVELLTRYREAVTGPLKAAGWQCEKADEIIAFLQSS